MRTLCAWQITGICVGLALAGCQHAQRGAAPETGEPVRVHPLLAMQPIPAGLGVNIHFYEGNADDWRLIDAAGLGMVRMDVTWASAERQPVVYDFSNYDKLLAMLGPRGIGVIFILDYGNPLYDGGMAPQSAECRSAFARFAAALASRYAGKRILWELWNEPNIDFWKPKPNVDDYIAWCQAVVPAIRAADANACIIGPATSGLPMSFLQKCFEGGLLALVDGVSVHPYRSAAKPPESALPEYAALASLIAQYKPASRQTAIPIISGEWGYSSIEAPPEQQGKYLARQWLTNLCAAIPIGIWYDWHDDGQDPAEREHHFGTVTWDYAPKPAYTAMKTLIAELQGFVPKGRIDASSSDDYIVVFQRNGAYKLAVWTTGAPHEIALPNATVVTRVVDFQGNASGFSQGPAILASDAPCYLTLGKPVPPALRGL